MVRLSAHPDHLKVADPVRAYRVVHSDRLYLLTKSTKAAQSYPYRHDPGTLSLFQTSILDAWRFMRENAARCPLFQVPRIEALAEVLMRRDYDELRKQREQFLWELYCYRRNKTPSDLRIPSNLTEQRTRFLNDPEPDRFWATQVDPTDVLAFALLIQFINVDRLLKWDMHYLRNVRLHVR